MSSCDHENIFPEFVVSEFDRNYLTNMDWSIFSYQVETCPAYLQSNENNFNEKNLNHSK